MASMAAGFCVRGKVPVLFMTSGAFVGLFIRDSVCVPNLNVKFVIVGERRPGFDGYFA